MLSLLNCMNVTVDFVQENRLLLTHYSPYYFILLIIIMGVNV